jgi:glycosyltransferase involved in cell wall biosynthesis
MRILYFSKDYCPHDHRFLAALSESEHQVFYLRLERGPRHTEDRPVPSGIEQVTWSGGLRPARLADSPGLLLELRHILQNIQPDVVHAGPIQSCALLAALSGFHPLLVMSWGFDLMKDVERNLAWRWATKYVLKRADWFTSDCEATHARALAYGLPSGRATVFPWGVDLEHFSPQPRQEPLGCSEGFTIFSNRSWEPNYGVDVLAKAFVQVARQRPEVRLLLLGGGSQAGLLKGIFNSGGVEDRVEYGGHIPNSDLPRYYRMADLYISASHVDGSSVSLMEALASGLPCLVSDIPANREWVTDGENGWLFPDGNVEALAARILQSIDQRDALNEMGLAARRLAEARADWKKNFLLLLDAYRNTIDHWKSRHGSEAISK